VLQEALPQGGDVCLDLSRRSKGRGRRSHGDRLRLKLPCCGRSRCGDLGGDGLAPLLPDGQRRLIESLEKLLVGADRGGRGHRQPGAHEKGVASARVELLPLGGCLQVTESLRLIIDCPRRRIEYRGTQSVAEFSNKGFDRVGRFHQEPTLLNGIALRAHLRTGVHLRGVLKESLEHSPCGFARRSLLACR